MAKTYAVYNNFTVFQNKLADSAAPSLFRLAFFPAMRLCGEQQRRYFIALDARLFHFLCVFIHVIERQLSNLH